MHLIKRSFIQQLALRFADKSPLIQVILGPRQVGKTTGTLQFLETYEGPSHYCSADATLDNTGLWLEQEWQLALSKGSNTLLVVDEIQKIANWSETIKKLWDNSRLKGGMKLLLLGSSSLVLQKGLTESLTGRFEVISVPHWSYIESKDAFGYTLEEYLKFGGYPGAQKFEGDFDRWFSYVKNSIVDTVIGQDILFQNPIRKPALFKQAFAILCGYPGQEVSYSTLLGQLQDKGNTDLIKYYLELFESAFLFAFLSKYSEKIVQSKTSSPKIIHMCPAFYTLQTGPRSISDSDKIGHAFDSLVGADLWRSFPQNTFYWRNKNHEVDYVVKVFDQVYGIEVKSGKKGPLKGLGKLKEAYPYIKTVVVDKSNYESFAKSPILFL